MFTSSSTVTNLVDAVGRDAVARCALVSIGPATSATLADLGLSVAAQAGQPSVEHLVEALAAHYTCSA